MKYNLELYYKFIEKARKRAGAYREKIETYQVDESLTAEDIVLEFSCLINVLKRDAEKAESNLIKIGERLDQITIDIGNENWHFADFGEKKLSTGVLRTEFETRLGELEAMEFTINEHYSFLDSVKETIEDMQARIDELKK